MYCLYILQPDERRCSCHAGRFQAELQSQQSASFSHPSPLHADASSASLHAESSSTHFTQSQTTSQTPPHASAGPSHDTVFSSAFDQQPHSTFQTDSSASETVPDALPSLNRQQPAQPGASSANKPPKPQSTAADAEDMAHLKAMAAQADRLTQVGCLFDVLLILMCVVARDVSYEQSGQVSVTVVATTATGTAPCQEPVRLAMIVLHTETKLV